MGARWQESGKPVDRSSQPASQDAPASESGASDLGCGPELAGWLLVGAALWCTSMWTDFSAEGHSLKDPTRSLIAA